MEAFNKYAFIVLCFTSTLLFSCAHAQALPPEVDQVTCLSIQKDYVELIESGRYRYAKEGKDKSMEKIDFSSLSSYQEYLNAAKTIVEQRNPKADMPCPIPTDTYKQLAEVHQWSETPKTSQLVAPYELAQNNNDKAILLIHGLTDSPFSFHDLSQFFYQQGFTVRTLLMPGHATAPSDLVNVKYSEWQVAANFAIKQTLKDYKEVYLGGLSTGGALVFNYLMEQEAVDKKIKGLFMWSPASKAKNDFAWLAKYVDSIPFVDWIDLDADIDFAKYESFPYNAGAQVYSIMSLVVGEKVSPGRKLQEIPVFVVASEHDETIDTAQTLNFVQEWQLASTAEQMKNSVLIYYGDSKNLPKKLPAVMNVIVPECSPENLCSDILDVSHIATTNSPDNLHYGIKGRYRSCGHYVKELEKYKACKERRQVVKGEVTAKNLTNKLPLQRLTYNPYYEEMLTEMISFLKATH